MINRTISGHLKKMLTLFPVVSLTGPRQSGKTTLLKSDFPEYKYYNLERIDHRQLISSDPHGFLMKAGPRIIFDEVQQLPELFSYIQVVSDDRNTNGQYILSGSQSFLLNSHISQSLAGRVSINNLFPFDYNEIRGLVNMTDPDTVIVNGFYPRLISQNIVPNDFYPSYLQTYIERDIRTLRSIENLSSFTRFLGLCAGRVGQILNISSLAADTGISVNTAKSWLSLLESSFIIYLLQPYYRNFNKRIIKAPKIYFYDTGVLSSLLRISAGQVHSHYLYGALFENLVIGEIIKSFVHSGNRPSVYYWRESNGVEIDCLIENNNRLIALEIKAGQTFNTDYLKNLNKFPADDNITKALIYAGTEKTSLAGINIFNWIDFSDLIYFVK
ncbi:MAG TPA: ATP-binding protein [Lentimicrobium sp.]|nr:ATP-binding protein [Lentimicrobium sp.]